MNPLMKKRLVKLWDEYHKAETEYLARGCSDTSYLMVASRRLAEITTRFSTPQLLTAIHDWDFPLWLMNDERITCREFGLKQPDRKNLPTIEWDGETIPTLSK